MDINVAAEEFYKQYVKDLPQNFDDVYVFHANSGEIFAFVAYLAKAYMKKNNAKNPLFIATKPYHMNIIRLYFPNAIAAYYDLYLKEPKLDVLGDFWEYDGHKYTQIFSPRHFDTVNGSLGRIHYFQAMLKTLGLNWDDACEPEPILNERSKDYITRLAGRIDLNLDKFVILAPEASTTEKLPESFWQNLVRVLKDNGYDIFLNAVERSKLDCKTYNLTYTDVFTLAEMSKGVISLKSGLTEYLTPAKTKHIVLGNKFFWYEDLTAKQCLDAYSVMKLPYIDKTRVFELNVESFSSYFQLIDNIISLLNSTPKN